MLQHGISWTGRQPNFRRLGWQSEAGYNGHFGWVVLTDFLFLLAFVSSDAGASDSMVDLDMKAVWLIQVSRVKRHHLLSV